MMLQELWVRSRRASRKGRERLFYHLSVTALLQLFFFESSALSTFKELVTGSSALYESFCHLCVVFSSGRELTFSSSLFLPPRFSSFRLSCTAYYRLPSHDIAICHLICSTIQVGASLLTRGRFSNYSNARRRLISFFESGGGASMS